MAFAPRIREELTQICGSKWVKDDEVTLYTYRSDGLTLYTKLPMGIVYPANSEELVRVVKVLYREKLTFLARGAGTGLSGGAVPQEDTVIIEMDRLKEIHDIDYTNRTITVGPGVVNLRISEKYAQTAIILFQTHPHRKPAPSVVTSLKTLVARTL